MNKFTKIEDYDRIMEASVYGGKVDLGPSIEGYSLDAIFGPIVSGEQTVAQAVESQKDKLQAAADNFFAKSGG